MLTTRHPMSIFWGPEAVYLHNDAAGDFLGEDRIAMAMGRPAAEVWRENWADRVAPANPSHPEWRGGHVAGGFARAHPPKRQDRGRLVDL